MWPNARIAVMGGPQAAGVLSQVALRGKNATKKEIEEFERPYIEQFDKESSPYFSTARFAVIPKIQYASVTLITFTEFGMTELLIQKTLEKFSA